jgi:hypothetical protein
MQLRFYTTWCPFNLTLDSEIFWCHALRPNSTTSEMRKISREKVERMRNMILECFSAKCFSSPGSLIHFYSCEMEIIIIIIIKLYLMRDYIDYLIVSSQWSSMSNMKILLRVLTLTMSNMLTFNTAELFNVIHFIIQLKKVGLSFVL